MDRIALLLKSYRGDLAYAERMVTSFHRHNADGLTLFVVVPDEDLAAFTPLAADTVRLLPESELSEHLVTEPLGPLRVGYANQEIVKLAFWELGLAANYFCVDSDAVFIADFGVADFMAEADVPFTVLVEDRELAVEPTYHDRYWQDRQAALRRIQDQVGLHDPLVRSCHGHQVFSSTVLRSFKEQFLAPRGWDYKDALAVAPYEFTWYNMWLQKDQTIPIHAREPYAKVFHHEGHHLEYILRGITVEDIARGYLLLVVNSNYSRDLGLMDPHAGKPQALAPYLSYGETAALVLAKIKDTWRRRVTARGRRASP
jgi:hypothetical protein